MPRANRYILPERIYHITHRCHNRVFLFRFAVDRNEYLRRLRLGVEQADVDLLAFCITSNHVHLLFTHSSAEALSALMQKVQGEFAEHYNRRKHRSGAFWEGRYHCTMIESGVHLWRCLAYIEMNMVRACVVPHPAQWPWSSYREISGQRERYRLGCRAALISAAGGISEADFLRKYEHTIQTSLSEALQRDPRWTESIAVGSETFVQSVVSETTNRRQFEYSQDSAGTWAVRESSAPYS